MEDPKLRLQYYKETGQQDEATRYEQYLKETGQSDAKPAPTFDPRTTRHDGVPFVDAPKESAGAGTKALGALASVGRGTPLEVIQATMRAGYGHQSYRQARDDIRGAEEAAPAKYRIPAQVIGTVAQAGAMPGGAMLQGARYGALNALGDADPDKGLKERVDAAGVDMALGAGIGGLAGAAGAIKNAPKGAIGRAARQIPGVSRAQKIAAEFRPVAGEIKPAAMDNVVEAVKTQRSAPPSVADVVKGTAKGTTGKQAHRTQAQFDHGAELMRARKAAQAARDPRQPMFDAFSKEAQTLDDGRAIPELDLEDLLRRSLRSVRTP